MTNLRTERRPAAPIDYFRSLRSEIPTDKKGYVLARFALAYATDNSHKGRFAKYAERALLELHDANETGELQPPLNDFVSDEIAAFLDELDSGRVASGQATALILSMALEMKGTQPNG